MFCPLQCRRGRTGRGNYSGNACQQQRAFQAHELDRRHVLPNRHDPVVGRLVGTSVLWPAEQLQVVVRARSPLHKWTAADVIPATPAFDVAPSELFFFSFLFLYITIHICYFNIAVRYGDDDGFFNKSFEGIV